MENNRIEKRIELKAPVTRVWKALTDYQQFGVWFRVQLEVPFVAGQATWGHITHPGYEHLRFEVHVIALEPERYFAFHWHPYAIDPAVDYTKETPTLVEFRLEPTPGGTLLLLTESGFDKVPEDRRLTAFRMNDNGWTQQMNNIEAYLEQGA